MDLKIKGAAFVPKQLLGVSLASVPAIYPLSARPSPTRTLALTLALALALALTLTIALALARCPPSSCRVSSSPPSAPS